MTHRPVLLEETLKHADIGDAEIVFEGTGGEGGLSGQIVSRLGPDGILIVTELDRFLVANLRKELVECECRVYVEHDNFRNIASILKRLGLSRVDVIIFDLGLASYHYTESGRGFSFQKNEPLLMTLDDSASSGVTAKDAVNRWKEENLRDIFAGLGGERYAKQIAKAIVLARAKKSIETTGDLVDIILTAVGKRRGAIHPATKIFQALRIAVNDEVGALHSALRSGWECLRSGGRFLVISFHEIEDREVKTWFKSLVDDGVATLLCGKGIKAGLRERSQNKGSRSARLRAVRKVLLSSHE